MRILALLVSCCYASMSLADTPCPRPTVTVSGSAQIRLVPDRVSFTVAVESEASSVTKAFEANNAKVRSVVASLLGNGAGQQDIQTSNFYLTQKRDEEGNTLPGFRVLNAVTVTREATADAGTLLQAAIEAGATEAGKLRFFVADPGKSEMQGLELSFADARAKAEKLAALSNRSLGDVISVTHQSYSQAAMLPSSAVITQNPIIEAGIQNLDFDVSVVFELK